MKDKKYRTEKRIQADGSVILVRGSVIKESKYSRHQGAKEMQRRLKRGKEK